jgi:hypothetical protein
MDQEKSNPKGCNSPDLKENLFLYQKSAQGDLMELLHDILIDDLLNLISDFDNTTHFKSIFKWTFWLQE